MLRISKGLRKEKKEKKEKKDKKDKNDKEGNNNNKEKSKQLKAPELVALSSDLCDGLLFTFNRFNENDNGELVVEFINTVQELQQRLKVQFQKY